MKYLAMIYANEKDDAAKGEAWQKQVFDEYMAFEQWLATERPGCKIAGDALLPVHTATTVRIRDGERMVTDGPFAETREQLGGYYLIECKDLDEAIDVASRIPSAKHGSIEVRPVMVFDMPA